MEDENPLTERARNSRFRITVEPAVFLFFTAGVLQSVVIQNLYLRKTCLINFHLNETECSSTTNATSGPIESDNQAAIQRYVTNLNIYGSLIENIPSVIFVLFLGPWSDRNGRKIPMICPLVGHILSVSLYLLNYFIESWPAEYLLLASIPLGLCGGSTTMFMSSNSYIADITTSESRTSRISFLYGAINIAFPGANFVSIYIYTYGGYLAIWGTSLALGVLALLYVVFFITDSRGPKSLHADLTEESDDSPAESSGCCSVISNLLECFTVTFMRRNGHKQACLILLLTSMSLFVLSGVPGNLAYLYTRKLFDWDQPQYALFSTIASLITAIGNFIILPLMSSCMKLNDCLVGMIAILATIGGGIGMAFAWSVLSLYLASVGYILLGNVGVVIRAMLSKLVLSDELSHVYSVLASFESIVNLLASPVYNLVYKATLDYFPGCFYILSSGFLLAVFILLSVILFLQWREKNTQVLYLPVDEPIPADNQSTHEPIS